VKFKPVSGKEDQAGGVLAVGLAKTGWEEDDFTK